MKKFVSVFLVFLMLLGVSIGFFNSGDISCVTFTANAEEKIQQLENDVNSAVVAAFSAAQEDKTSDYSALSVFGYVVVTQFINADGSEDVSNEIQAIIDANPNKTIYFPDGVYLISKPINTPAEPSKSVDLQLSNYAVIKATADFEGDALIRLGGKDSANDTHTVGSNYSLTGGVLDGSGVANGVAIVSGRETAIREVSIKNTVIGINVMYGANSGSSDADISDVNIIGTGTVDSIGVYVEGYDNTFTNMRIGNVYTGFYIKSSANSLRNIHPLYYSDYTDYENSCGFYDVGGNNIYDFCYSDQFCVGFWTANGVSSIYDNCFCFWYSQAGGKEVGFRTDGKFNSVCTNLRLSFRDDTQNYILELGEMGGSGVFENLLADSSKTVNWAYKTYLRGNIVWFIRHLFV